MSADIVGRSEKSIGIRTSDAESCSVTKVSSMAVLFESSSSSSASMLLSLACVSCSARLMSARFVSRLMDSRSMANVMGAGLNSYSMLMLVPICPMEGLTAESSVNSEHVIDDQHIFISGYCRLDGDKF